jgi:hypothetical protein
MERDGQNLEAHPLGLASPSHLRVKVRMGALLVSAWLKRPSTVKLVSVKAGAFGGCNLASSGVAGLC